MSGPTVIWAVEAGSYSDYGVMALFEREEDARAALAAGMGDDVSAFTYYPAGSEQPRKVGYWRAGATLWPDGRAEQPRTHPMSGWTSMVGWIPPTKRATVTEHASPMPDGRVYITAECLTEEGALKAVADRLARLRSERMEPEAGR